MITYTIPAMNENTNMIVIPPGAVDTERYTQ